MYTMHIYRYDVNIDDIIIMVITKSQMLPIFLYGLNTLKIEAIFHYFLDYPCILGESTYWMAIRRADSSIFCNIPIIEIDINANKPTV